MYIKRDNVTSSRFMKMTEVSVETCLAISKVLHIELYDFKAPKRFMHSFRLQHHTGILEQQITQISLARGTNDISICVEWLISHLDDTFNNYACYHIQGKITDC